MKFKKIKILTTLVFAAIMFTACSKDDGPIPERIGIEEVPAMTMNLEPQKLNNIDTIRFGTPGTFTGRFKVAMVFPSSDKPSKVDIVVRKNGSAANVKLFKPDIATFPSSFTVTAAEIVALFGAPLALNDTYDFAPDIYVGDRKYQAWPAVGVGNGAGVVNMNSIGYYELVRITVKN
jgi:hypothetical protein